MSSTAKNTRSTVVPCLRYRDAPKAIEWLCSVFGFEKQFVVPNDDGTIAHAQLSFGNGMVMLGSVSTAEGEFGHLTKQPDEIGGVETQKPIPHRVRCRCGVSASKDCRSKNRN